MQIKTQLTVLALFSSLATMPAMADHKSVNGAGWANMPNDIHNTRLEDNLDSTAWRDFVSKGAGSQTINRYTDTTTSVTGQRSMTGMANQPAKASTGRR